MEDVGALRRVTVVVKRHGNTSVDAAHTLYEHLKNSVHRCFDIVLYEAKEHRTIEFTARMSCVPLIINELIDKQTSQTLEAIVVINVADLLAMIHPKAMHPSRAGLADEPSALARICEHMSNAFSPASRMTIEEIWLKIEAAADLNFDFMLLVIGASVTAAAGLIDDSVVPLLGAMMISPLVSPINSLMFGLAVGDKRLVVQGLLSESAGVAMCLVCGFITGLILSPMYGPPLPAENASLVCPVEDRDCCNYHFPFEIKSSEIDSRGTPRALIAGTPVALASGVAGVIGLVSGDSNPITGTLIAVALLPPIVNVGMSLALSVGEEY